MLQQKGILYFLTNWETVKKHQKRKTGQSIIDRYIDTGSWKTNRTGEVPRNLRKLYEAGNHTGIDIYEFKLKMANTLSVMTNVLRNVVSKQRIRYKEKGFNLDLAYVCDNIIAMGYPAEKYESMYRNRLEDVYKFLEENHHDHYKIYNLCLERSYDIKKFHGRVSVYPFEDHNPPTIELIQKFCEDVDSWLKKDSLNVAAVHCKAGKGRTGTMICCYLLYSGQQRTAEDALACYDEKRTKDRKGVTIPSQRRYVQYFSKLIGLGLPYVRRTLQFCEIRFAEASLLHSQGTVHCSISVLQDTECAVKVQTLQNLSIDFRKSCILDIKNPSLPVTGDIKVELTKNNKKIFHLWFNTFFVCDAAVLEGEGNDVKLVYTLNKWEIDDAHKDKEHKNFSEDFKVDLVFYVEDSNAGRNQITVPSSNNRQSTQNTVRLPANNSTLSQTHSNCNDTNNYICDQKSSSSASMSSFGGSVCCESNGYETNRIQRNYGQYTHLNYVAKGSNQSGAPLAGSLPPAYNHLNDVSVSVNLPKQHNRSNNLLHHQLTHHNQELQQLYQVQQQQQQQTKLNTTTPPTQRHAQRTTSAAAAAAVTATATATAAAAAAVTAGIVYHQPQFDGQQHQHQHQHQHHQQQQQQARQEREHLQYQPSANRLPNASREALTKTTANSSSEEPTYVNNISNMSNSSSVSSQSSASAIGENENDEEEDDDEDEDEDENEEEEEEDWESGESPAKQSTHTSLPYSALTSTTTTSSTSSSRNTATHLTSDESDFKPSLGFYANDSNTRPSSSKNNVVGSVVNDDNNDDNDVDDVDDDEEDDDGGDDDDNYDHRNTIRNSNCKYDSTAGVTATETTRSASASASARAPIITSFGTTVAESSCCNTVPPKIVVCASHAALATSEAVGRRPKFMQLLMAPKSNSSQSSRKSIFRRKMSFKPSSAAAISPTNVTVTDGPLAVKASASLGTVTATPKQKLKIKLKKNKLKLSQKFRWFQSYFRNDPVDFCETFVQQTTAMRRNSMCSIPGRTHKLSTTTPPPSLSPLPPPVPPPPPMPSEPAALSSGGHLATTSAAILNAEKKSVSTSNASITSGDLCDDYYSSICDNQLSFNNSPCKSPRSLVDIVMSGMSGMSGMTGSGSGNGGSSYAPNAYPITPHNAHPTKVSSGDDNEATTDDATSSSKGCGGSDVVVVAAKPAKTHAIGFNVDTIDSLPSYAEDMAAKPTESVSGSIYYTPPSAPATPEAPPEVSSDRSPVSPFVFSEMHNELAELKRPDDRVEIVSKPRLRCPRNGVLNLLIRRDDSEPFATAATGRTDLVEEKADLDSAFCESSSIRCHKEAVDKVAVANGGGGGGGVGRDENGAGHSRDEGIKAVGFFGRAATSMSGCSNSSSSGFGTSEGCTNSSSSTCSSCNPFILDWDRHFAGQQQQQQQQQQKVIEEMAASQRLPSRPHSVGQSRVATDDPVDVNRAVQQIADKREGRDGGGDRGCH